MTRTNETNANAEKEVQNYLDDAYDRQKDAEDNLCEMCHEEQKSKGKKIDDMEVCDFCWEQAIDDGDMREYDGEYQESRAEHLRECQENGGIGR